MGRISVRRSTTRIVVGTSRERRDDILAVEEPLEIRVPGEALSITMRTPGHDFELATGFLVSEGVIARGDQVRSIRYCAGAPSEENTLNVLDVSLSRGVPLPDPSLVRNFLAGERCAAQQHSRFEGRDRAVGARARPVALSL